MKTLQQLGDELDIALEELTTVYAIYPRMAGMEHYSNSTISSTFYQTALEAQNEAKHNWIRTVMNFFQRMWTRLKDWWNKRKATGKEKDITERVEKYKQAVKEFREDVNNQEKEFSTVAKDAKNPENVFKKLQTQADQEVEKLLNDAGFLQSQSSLNVAGAALYFALGKSASNANNLAEKMTRAAQLLSTAGDYFQRSVEETRRGRQQARQLIEQMLHNLLQCASTLEEIDKDIEKLSDPANIPKTVQQAFDSFAPIKTYQRLLDLPVFKSMRDDITGVFNAGEDLMKWFENVSNQNTFSSGNDLNDKIYDIGAQSINDLSKSPAQFMSMISRIEKVQGLCIPPDLRGFITSVAKNAGDKISAQLGKTPQEKSFLKDYCRYVVENKASNALVKSAA